MDLNIIIFKFPYSTPKHKFKKNLNSIQHPNTFSLPRNLQTDSKYYSYSKNSTPKRTIIVSDFQSFTVQPFIDVEIKLESQRRKTIQFYKRCMCFK
jgi:hypothetical protein